MTADRLPKPARTPASKAGTACKTGCFVHAGVKFVPLKLTRGGALGRLPLAAAWLRGSRDPVRESMLAVLETRLRQYGREA